MLIFISCSKGESTLMTKNKKNKNLKSLIKPDYLKSGDTIAIIAPSGVLNNRNQAIENAKKLIIEWGLVPIIGKIFTKKLSFCR